MQDRDALFSTGRGSEEEADPGTLTEETGSLCPPCRSLSEPQNKSGACLSALRGPGHLHDRGAEEVLQRHEEAGLQEAPEAHPEASGEPGSQFSKRGAAGRWGSAGGTLRCPHTIQPTLRASSWSFCPAWGPRPIQRWMGALRHLPTHSGFSLVEIGRHEKAVTTRGCSAPKGTRLPLSEPRLPLQGCSLPLQGTAPPPFTASSLQPPERKRPLVGGVGRGAESSAKLTLLPDQTVLQKIVCVGAGRGWRSTQSN